MEGEKMDCTVLKNPHSNKFLWLNEDLISILFNIRPKNGSAALMAEIPMVQSLNKTSHEKEYLEVLQICTALRIRIKTWLKNILGRNVISISVIKLLFTKLQFFIYKLNKVLNKNQFFTPL